MRIVGGHHRGRRLVAPKGDRTRPTGDRVREAVFDILFDVEGLTFLDLFAGTGAVGLEALSRGARTCVFAETDRSALVALEENIARLGLEDRADVRRVTVPRLLADLSRDERSFDIVFADPPWDRVKELIPGIIESVSSVLSADGRFILEHGAREVPPPAPPGIELFDQRKYGDTALAFYRPIGRTG